MRKPLGPFARGCRVCGGVGTRRSGSAVVVLAGIHVHAVPGIILGCERDRELACNTTKLIGVILRDYGTAGGLRHGGGSLCARRSSPRWRSALRKGLRAKTSNARGSGGHGGAYLGPGSGGVAVLGGRH